jgi:hypothetical protein
MRRNPGNKSRKTEIRDIQRLLVDDIKKKSTLPHIRAQCARAYDVLEERLRILSGKPLPGMLRPDLALEREAKKGKRKAPALLPMPEVPAGPADGLHYVPEKDGKESLSNG